jgi:uncharacterized membrane protein YdcZ (DUF606 family)
MQNLLACICLIFGIAALALGSVVALVDQRINAAFEESGRSIPAAALAAAVLGSLGILTSIVLLSRKRPAPTLPRSLPLQRRFPLDRHHTR